MNSITDDAGASHFLAWLITVGSRRELLFLYNGVVFIEVSSTQNQHDSSPDERRTRSFATIRHDKLQQINEPHTDNLVRRLYREQYIDGMNGSADDAFSHLEPVLTDKGLWRLHYWQLANSVPRPVARNDA